MASLDDIFQISILILLIICLLTIVIICLLAFTLLYRRKNKEQQSYNHQLEYRNQELFQQYQQLENENLQLRNMLYSKEDNSQKQKPEQKNEKDSKKYIREHLSDYFYTRHSMLSSNESRMYFYMCISLDKIFPDKKYRDDYLLFPQVNLYAFITNKVSSVPADIIGGKHTDFVLCHKYREPKSGFYCYEPMLMIEIDDCSHFSSDVYGDEAFKKIRYNDRLKNDLSTGLNLPLLRYRLSDKGVSKNDNEGIYTALCQILKNIDNPDAPKLTQYIYYYDRSGILNEYQYYMPIKSNK